ncbi:gliding motility-associated C-terminal domain-containing protein [bacterium]|nr:gliding motility-associated C-terminal domain-containing protein [bacterium]
MRYNNLILPILLISLVFFSQVQADSTSAVSDLGVLDNCSPRVTIDFPGLNDTLICNSDSVLLWTAIDSFFNPNPIISIEYSYDGGPFTSLASDEENDGIWEWLSIPPISSNNVLILLTAIDSLGNIGSDTSEVFTIYCNVVGPVARIIEPLPNTVTSCDDQEIIVEILDVDGVDASTIRLSIISSWIADTFDISDSRLTFVNDTLRFTPVGPTWEHCETVQVCLLEAMDNFGNSLAAGELCWSFLVDLLPPELVSSYPIDGGTVYDTLQPITIRLVDDCSGIDPDSLLLIVNDSNLTLDDPCLTLDDTMLYFDPALCGMSFPFGTTAEYCLMYARDFAEYCGPNVTPPNCFQFFIWLMDTLGPTARLITPHDGWIVACTDQIIMIMLTDTNPVEPSSIILEVNGIPYTTDSTQLEYTDLLLIFTPSEWFVNGELIEINLLAAEDVFGNPMARTYYWSFTMDLAPPIFVGYSPTDDTLRSATPEIRFEILDSISGVDPFTLQITINGSLFTFPGDFNWEFDEIIFDPADHGMAFSNGENVEACLVIAGDSPDTCIPNTLRDTCFNFIVDLAGPHTFIHSPTGYTSCEYQTIEIDFSSRFGVDSTSISFRLNADIMDIYDPELSLSGLTLTYTPTIPFSDGDTLNVSLISLEDTTGIGASELPHAWSFIVDLTPPEVTPVTPGVGTTVVTPPELITVTVSDRLAGLRLDSLWIQIDGGTRYFISDPGVFWGEPVLGFYPDSAGVVFADYDTVEVCVGAMDLAEYCGPNGTLFCWTFYISRGDNPVARIDSPEDVFIDGEIWVACPTECIVIVIDDPDSNLVLDSIRFNIDMSTFFLSSPGVTWVGDEAHINITYCPPDGWDDNDTIIVTNVVAYDSYGNPLAGTPPYLEFMTDFSPPEFSGVIPSDTILATTSAAIGFSATDLRDVINESLYVYVNGVFRGSRASANWSVGSLEDGDSVCVTAVCWDDTADYGCPIYTHRAETTWCFLISFGEVPIATLSDPVTDHSGDGEIWVACPTETLFINFTDSDSNLIPDSIRVQVNDDTLTIYSAGVTWTGDGTGGTFAYLPEPSGWIEGVVYTVTVLAAVDSLGNILADPPSPLIFSVDYSPPILSAFYPLPGAVVTVPSIDAYFSSEDLGIDVRIDSLYVEIDGMPLTAVEDSGTSLDSLEDGEEVCLTAVSWDDYCDYGCPEITHRAETTWCFTLDFAGISVSGPNLYICQGSADSFDITAAGGSGTLSFLWSPPDFLSDVNVLNPLVDPDIPTSPDTLGYTLTVTDSFGVAVEETFYVFLSSPMYIYQLFDGEMPDSHAYFCEGEDLNISFDISGGVPPYTAEWHLSTGETLYFEDSTLTMDTTTEFTVVITDAFGCRDSTTAEAWVCDSPAPFSWIYPAPDEEVPVGPVTLIWEASYVSEGILTYDVYLDDILIADDIIDTTFTTDSIPCGETHTWTVVAENNCYGECALVDSFPMDPPFHTEPCDLCSLEVYGADAAICYGESSTFGVYAEGATADLEITWDPADGLSDPTILNPVAAPETTSTYIITARDTAFGPGCIDVDTFTIVVSPEINISYWLFAEDTFWFCMGYDQEFYADFTGGIPPYSYEWTINDTGVITDSSFTHPMGESFNLVLTVYDSLGCWDSDTLLVLVCDTLQQFYLVSPEADETVPPDSVQLIWTSADVILGNVYYDVYLDDSLIASGITDTFTWTNPIPCGETHSWGVWAYSDCDGCDFWREIFGDPVFHTSPCLYPDLYVEDSDIEFEDFQLQPITRTEEGDSLLIYATVHNDSFETLHNFVVCFSINGSRLDSFIIDSLLADDEITLTLRDAFPEGAYEICAYADCGDRIFESEENNNEGCAVLYVIGVKCDAHPTPFSPNGDNYNDEVKFEYPGIAEREGIIRIYDINNTLVRELDGGVSDWDGFDEEGHRAPKGIYIYIIEKDSKIVCNGTIYLVR